MNSELVVRYNKNMMSKLNDEQIKALEHHADGPAGGDEFDPNEFMPLVHEALADDIDAPGMELYDNYDAHCPSPKP